MRSPETIIRDFLTVTVLAVSVTFGLAGYGQDKPASGKDEKTVTLKIVKDDNGKVTVIDTTITSKGEGKGQEFQYEYSLRDMEKEMAEVEARMRDLDLNFDFNGEDFDFPEFPMSPQWEALLQSIPMGKITGFQVKDRKGGKRVIIDIDDSAPVIIMAPSRHRGSGHGYGQKKVIIRSDMEDFDVPPPPPPPPPDAPKEQTPKPEKG